MTRVIHRKIMQAVYDGKLVGVTKDQVEEGKTYICKAFGLVQKENGTIWFTSPINGAVYPISPNQEALFYEYKGDWKP